MILDLESHEPGCRCDDPLADWEPSPEHEALLDEVRGYVAKWGVRLPWLAGWTIRVSPLPEGCGDWTMRVDSAAYVKIATIEVRESALEGDVLLGDEYCVELMVLHELTHIAFEALRYVYYNWVYTEAGMPQSGLLAQMDAEETAVWAVSRALMAQERHLDAATREIDDLAHSSKQLASAVVERTRRKRGEA